MAIPLDPHGQPMSTAFNRKMRRERDITELLGIAKGVLADGVVVDDEVRFLNQWAINHPDGLNEFPVNLIFSRLAHIYSDGHVDDEERVELQDLLEKLVGGTESLLLGYDASSKLPLCDPPPLVSWFQEVFVFTGKFAFGTRRNCWHEVMSRGGDVEEDVSRRTTFVVIGTFGSEDWRRSAYGRKIEKAVDLRSQGFPLRIVGEDHWCKALSRSES